jgi:hypothetical protein
MTLPGPTLFFVVLVSLFVRVYSSGEYLESALPVWTKEIGQISKGNGAFISPNGKVLVIISKDASAKGFDPITGNELWSYTPNGTSTSVVQSYGGAFFSEFASQSYLLYSVVENAIFPEHATRYERYQKSNRQEGSMHTNQSDTLLLLVN